MTDSDKYREGKSEKNPRKGSEIDNLKFKINKHSKASL